MPPLVLTLLHHPDDAKAFEGIVGQIGDHFDRLGMERAGVHMRIPVRARSAMFGQGPELRPIRQSAKRLDVVVAFITPQMDQNSQPWRDLIIQLKQDFADEPERLYFQPVIMAPTITPWDEWEARQAVNWSAWNDVDRPAKVNRLMLHLVDTIRKRLLKLEPGELEPIFISHAKADGNTLAKQLVSHIQNPSNDLKLASFFDAKQLESGGKWREELESGAAHCSLLALVSDAYDTRPWCNQEILWAKQHRRPILLVDVGRKKVGRSFPYSGNLPLVALPSDDVAGFEYILLELLSEALRCDLFLAEAEECGDEKALVLPRPPELCDLAHLAQDAEKDYIVYPDPPISSIEAELLGKASGGRQLVTLSEKGKI